MSTKRTQLGMRIENMVKLVKRLCSRTNHKAKKIREVSLRRKGLEEKAADWDDLTKTKPYDLLCKEQI